MLLPRRLSPFGRCDGAGGASLPRPEVGGPPSATTRRTTSSCWPRSSPPGRQAPPPSPLSLPAFMASYFFLEYIFLFLYNFTDPRGQASFFLMSVPPGGWREGGWVGPAGPPRLCESGRDEGRKKIGWVPAPPSPPPPRVPPPPFPYFHNPRDDAPPPRPSRRGRAGSLCKRIAKDSTKTHGRSLGKISHCAPAPRLPPPPTGWAWTKTLRVGGCAPGESKPRNPEPRIKALII